MHLDQALQFWGKARPLEGAVTAWHPVAFHCLDVACVAEALLERRATLRASARRFLGASDETVLAWLPAVIALHDLGKFSRPFQALVPELWPSSLGAMAPGGYAVVHHTVAGMHLWQDGVGERLLALFSESRPDAAEIVMGSVFGHHGRPLATQIHRPRLSGMPEVEIAGACTEALCSAFLGNARPPALSSKAGRRLSWWLAGIVSLADWIGSTQEWFPYTDPGSCTLDQYLAIARDRAQVAAERAGLRPPRPAPRQLFVALTGRDTPTPVQQWADEVSLVSDPLLIIVEDVTGSGKTEAAHLLSHRLLAEHRVAGAYWAMPTQATANAMFDRQRKLISQLFEADSRVRPSLVLAHGQSRLHDGFRAEVLGASARQATARTDSIEDEELPSEVACPAFLADDRRAAFLADVGAGTIDQALLGVLPSKFNTIRLLGLGDKVLVVDEAHAYDAFTRVELERLLEFQSALGGSAIVLTATLTANQRQRMIAAWHEGAGLRRPGEVLPDVPLVEAMADPYPMATVCSGMNRIVESVSVPAPAHVSRDVPVRLTDDTAAVVMRLRACAEQGGCVAWIRNTVDSCLRTAALLEAEGLRVDVFHARFAQGDRQRRERSVMSFAGKDADAGQRRGRILLSTQVIEQSLDLDFDVLVTDLAPIDLLIQRMGRLHRHRSRDAGRPASARCELVVLAPEANEGATPGWLDHLMPGTRYVYPDAGIMWRTARILAHAGRIEIPHTVRRLIESVYDPNGECPPALVSVADRARGTANSHAAAANYGTLRVGEGYHGDQSVWQDDVRAVTRMGDEHTTLRLARAQEHKLTPWWDDEELPAWHRWGLSEVRVRAYRVPFGACVESRFEASVSQARNEWGRFEQEIPVLPLEQVGDSQFEGVLLLPSAAAAPSKRLVIRYSPARGLEFDS